MSVFATLRRSVGFGGGGVGSTSTSPIANKPTSITSAESINTESEHKVKPSPTSNTIANLSLENKHGKHKATYPIKKEITKIGRLATNDIRIYRETVSRIHCEVHVKVENSTSIASLHVFNPKGLKINGKEVDNETKGERIVPLLDGDLIEIYSNFFRMQLNKDDFDKENDENSPSLSHQARKSIRMSLVRSKVNQKTESNEIASSSSATQENASTVRIERLPLGSLSCAQVGQEKVESSQIQASRNSPFATSPSKKVMAKQGRRSLVFATPRRESVSQQSWTAEPIKRSQKPISPKKPTQALKNDAEGDDSIVFMEEIEEENDKEDQSEKENEMLPNELDELLAVAPVTGPDSLKDNQIDAESCSYARQTKSVSPKKVKRRSSFFGRAGVFANWNFGFYPEERKAAEEEDVNRELSPSPSLSPITSPNGTRYLPDPRLDSQGRPRLPRSLSSPDGLGHSSPKRRIVSLRTATLLRQGQNAFEQQKSRSPPPSPTKSSLSNGTTHSLMGQMQQLLISVDRPKDSSDADDEDEIDQSLSLADDEKPEELIEAPKASLPISKPRKSDSLTIERSNQANEHRKSRISMPAKLLSIVSVDGHSNEDIEDLKKQWLAEQEERDEQDDLKDLVQDTLANQDQGHETDTDSENESDDEVINAKQDNIRGEEPATPSSKIQYGMLRYMVRENAELTALLDTVANPEGEKATESHQEILEAAKEVELDADVKEISLVEESTKKNDVSSNDDGEWQIVSPRRARWEPSERKPIENRRVSDTFASQKKQKVSPKKKSQRRVTAAVTTSLPIQSGSSSSSKLSTGDKYDTEKQSNEQDMALSTVLSNEILIVEEPKAEQKSPKKRSPSKQSLVKRSPAKVKLAPENSSSSGIDTVDEVITNTLLEEVHDSSSDIASKNGKNPMKTKQETRSPLKGISPSKKVNSNIVAAPLPSSPKRLRSRSPVKQIDEKHEEDDDKENEIPIALQSSSPAKKTRSAAKPAQSRGRKKSKEESEMQGTEAEPVDKSTLNTRRSTRTTKKASSKLDIPASEPAMPMSEPNVRTTRSGRSVRKPKDLAQPTTVVEVQSDPVEPATSNTGRITRNRARKAAAA